MNIANHSFPLDLLPEGSKQTTLDKRGLDRIIKEMFDTMNDKLTERIDSYDETEMNCEAFNNARSALKLYAKFIELLSPLIKSGNP